MRLTAVALAALLASQPFVALSQPSGAPTSQPTSAPVLLKLPVGTRLATPKGTFQGYTLPEMKIILRIEADYRAWGHQIPEYEKIVKDYKLLSDNQDKQVKLLKNQVVVLKKDHVRLTKKWTEENKLRHLCENKPNFGSWIAWSVAAAMAATAAVLAGVVIAKD
jgi:hypothetical protein